MEARSVLELSYFTTSKNIKLMGTRKKFNEKFKAGRLGPRDSCRAEQQECGRESLRASFAILESTPITARLAELSNCMRSAWALAHIHTKSSSTLGLSCVGGWSRRSIVLYLCSLWPLHLSLGLTYIFEVGQTVINYQSKKI